MLHFATNLSQILRAVDDCLRSENMKLSPFEKLLEKANNPPPTDDLEQFNNNRDLNIANSSKNKIFTTHSIALPA